MTSIAPSLPPYCTDSCLCPSGGHSQSLGFSLGGDSADGTLSHQAIEAGAGLSRNSCARVGRRQMTKIHPHPLSLLFVRAGQRRGLSRTDCGHTGPHLKSEKGKGGREGGEDL